MLFQDNLHNISMEQIQGFLIQCFLVQILLYAFLGNALKK